MKDTKETGERERQRDTESCPAVACVLPFVDLWWL